MELTKGNYNKLVVGPIRDTNKAIITNLPTAASVRYLVKLDPLDDDEDALIEKDLTDGITVDDPSQGCISVVLLPADTETLEKEIYYHGLQIEYSSTNIQEIKIKENGKAINTFTLVQDVVRKP